MSVKAGVAELGARVTARDPVSVARAISLVEDRRPEAEPHVIELLRTLSALSAGRTHHRVGLTGPPGVGKSSLVSVLARVARRDGRTVGVLAVDPSSPRSGGALLGDRARIDVDPEDTGLYVRSMASRGDLGGLARASGAAVEVLSAAYDLVIVETTGVGQSETDVEHVADTVVMVIQPGSGDVLSFLKAGIIEIPDVFVVNKSDLGELAERVGSDLAAALSTAHAGAHGAPPILRTSATTGDGVGELLHALDAHRARLDRAGELEPRRLRARVQWALRLYTLRFGDEGVLRAGGHGALGDKIEKELSAGATAVEAVDRLRPRYA